MTEQAFTSNCRLHQLFAKDTCLAHVKQSLPISLRCAVMAIALSREKTQLNLHESSRCSQLRGGSMRGILLYVILLTGSKPQQGTCSAGQPCSTGSGSAADDPSHPYWKYMEVLYPCPRVFSISVCCSAQNVREPGSCKGAAGPISRPPNSFPTLLVGGRWITSALT